MNERLDHLVERLAASPTDHSLAHFEAQVARGIAGRRAQVRTDAALAPVGVASIALALVIGVMAGGLTAASTAAPRTSVGSFSVAADLAPSTLLEGGR